MIGASVLLKSGVTAFSIAGTSADLAGSTTQGSLNGTGAAARFWNPTAMEFDTNGDLIICDSSNSLIRKLVVSTGVVTTVAGGATAGASETNGNGTAASFVVPRGIAITNGNVMYVGDSGFMIIRKITGVNNTVSTFAGNSTNTGYLEGTGTTARFFTPEGITLNSSNELFVADKSNNSIRKITTGATTSLLAGSTTAGTADGTGAAARFNSPRAITIDSNGNFYVCDTNNHAIRKITSTGVVTTLAGTKGTSGTTDGTGTAARFNAPSAIKYNSVDGNLYVCDSGNHTIRKVTLAGVVTTLAGLAGTFGDAVGTGTTARFRSPGGIAIDSTGSIYIADSINNKIKKIT